MGFRIPFSGRAHAYTRDEVRIVVDAMRDAVPLTQGKYLAAFEKKFSRRFDVPHAFAVCNATAALEMAAQLCCFEAGNEVIIPSHTFTSSAYPFLKKGAHIVWADIDPETRVVTAETIERHLTSRTKAIVVVHLYGYGADMPAITHMARKHHLLVVEDAAQALGVEIDGKWTGSFGDFGIFSFHSQKNITTLGEGGMLAVRDEEYARIIAMLRHNGHCGFDHDRKDYWIPAMGDVVLPMLGNRALWPNNYCLGEVECALGAKLLDRLDEMNTRKRERAIHVIDSLRDFPELEFHRVETRRHNYHLLAARMVQGKRDFFIRRMAQDFGIQCVVQYCPLNRYPLYRKSGAGEADCPNADMFFDNMVSFPFHHTLSDGEIDSMIEASKKVLTALRTSLNYS